MAAEEKVQEYTRTTKNGQTVQVKAHSRLGQDAQAHALARPGRPPIAARGGQFPNGRSIPGIFVAPTTDVEGTVPPPQPLSNPDEHDDFGKALPDHLRAIIEPKFDAKTGKPLKTTEPSKKAQKVVEMASSLWLDSPDIVALTAGDE